MDVDTREMVETFGHHTGLDALYPDWAPDGQRIVFQIGSTVAVRTLGTEPGWIPIDGGRYPSWHPGG